MKFKVGELYIRLDSKKVVMCISSDQNYDWFMGKVILYQSFNGFEHSIIGKQQTLQKSVYKKLEDV